MKEQFIDDLKEIRSIMSERSRFLSLSGLSGVLAGIYALVGAYVAYKMARNASSIAYYDLKSGEHSLIVWQLLVVALIILILSLGTSYYFTAQKAHKRGEKIWSPASYKALKSFLIPLITGGIFSLLLIVKGELEIVASATLIFYGLALCAASSYTVRDISSLGIFEITLGLISLFFTGYGLYFWAFGFGVLHIIYGIIMYYKYDRV